MSFYGRPKNWPLSKDASWPSQKEHFRSHNSSDHDIMQKRRLASRTFGFRRYPTPFPTATLVQSTKGYDDYASEGERHSTDIETHLKQLQSKCRRKKDEAAASKKAQRSYQTQKARNQREEAWQREMERDDFLREKPHPRVIANKSCTNYDLFTFEYLNSFGGQQLRYEDDYQKWKDSWRRHNLRSKVPGSKAYNIVNWKKLDDLEQPSKPKPPVPPEPKPRRMLTPIPSKVLLSSEQCPPCPRARVDLIDYGPTPEPYDDVGPPKVRDIFVGEKHPWQYLV